MALIFSSNNYGDSGVWTLVGSPVLVNDRFNDNAGIDCDGDNDSAQAAGTLNSGTDITTVCWFKIASGLSQQGTLLAQFVNSGQQQFIMRMETDGDIDFNLLDTDGASTSASTTQAAIWDDDEWHHAACAHSTAAGIEISIDGVNITALTIQQTDFSSFGTTLAPLRTGIRGDGANKLNGIITRPRVYDDFRDAAARTVIYNSEIALLNGGMLGSGSRTDFRLDVLRQTRKNRGTPRFNR